MLSGAKGMVAMLARLSGALLAMTLVVAACTSETSDRGAPGAVEAPTEVDVAVGGGEADPGSLGGAAEGAGEVLESEDLCELLTEPIAERVAGDVDLEPVEPSDIGKTRSEVCQFEFQHDAALGVLVTLDVTGQPWAHCGKTSDPCEIIEKDVPPLPEGTVSWHDTHVGNKIPFAVWVQWEAAGQTWALWYSDNRFFAEDDAPSALRREDALVAAAEELHDRISEGERD